MLDDYRCYYYLEAYIFNTVGGRFRNGGEVTLHDFFCIIAWKANRAKSKEYQRLKRNAQQRKQSVPDLIAELLKQLKQNTDPRWRFDLLLNKPYKFQLPMATAVLSVLDPDHLTIYDKRVREELKFPEIYTRIPDKRWDLYQKFVSCVRERVKQEQLQPNTLREGDRWLWGKSFCEQLCEDLKTEFLR